MPSQDERILTLLENVVELVKLYKPTPPTPAEEPPPNEIVDLVGPEPEIPSPILPVKLLLQALPQELISKIQWYVLESPHTDLEYGVWKHAMGTAIYNKLVDEGGVIVKDGHVVDVDADVLHPDELRCLNFDIQFLQSLANLTQFCLGSSSYFDLRITGVTGDIAVLQSLPKLTQFYLPGTGVTGSLQ